MKEVWWMEGGVWRGRRMKLDPLNQRLNLSSTRADTALGRVPIAESVS